MKRFQEDLKLPDFDGRYMAINIISRRARELNRQMRNAPYEETLVRPVDIAAQEFKDGRLIFDFQTPGEALGEDYRSADLSE